MTEQREPFTARQASKIADNVMLWATFIVVGALLNAVLGSHWPINICAAVGTIVCVLRHRAISRRP